MLLWLCANTRFGNRYAFCGIILLYEIVSVQKEEWKLHQLECQAMAALAEDRKKMLTPTIRLMVRLVLKRKLQNEKVAAGIVATRNSHFANFACKKTCLVFQLFSFDISSSGEILNCRAISDACDFCRNLHASCV